MNAPLLLLPERKRCQWKVNCLINNYKIFGYKFSLVILSSRIFFCHAAVIVKLSKQFRSSL